MAKLDFPTTPLILGFVLGDGMERALRQSLTMSQGDPSIFFDRPITVILLLIAAFVLALPMIGRLRRARRGMLADI